MRWTWTRLRAAPGAAAAFACLVLVCTGTATALPRVADAYATGALRETLASAPLPDRLVSGASGGGDRATGARERLLPPAVDRSAEAFAEAVGPLPTDPERAVHGVHNRAPAEVTDPGLPRPTPTRNPVVSLVAQQGMAGHLRLVAGRMPDPRVTKEGTSQHLEAALTTATAHRMGLEPGDTFHPKALLDTTVTVTGLVEPRGPGSVFWNAEPSLDRPTRITHRPPGPGSAPEYFWRFSALIHREATPALLAMGGGAERYWHHPLASGDLRGHQVPTLLDGLSSLATGPAATRLETETGGTVDVDDRLASLLSDYEQERSAMTPLLVMAGAGLATAAVTVLLLWGVLACERRRGELGLLRSRGGSVRGVAARLLAETAVLGLPASAAGTALALGFVPGGRLGPALLLSGLVTAVAVLTLPVRAALVHRRTHDPVRTRSGWLRGGRRRMVAEATVLVLVVGAVVALRRRGAGGAEQADPLLAATPVLVSLAVALLLVRCVPLPLRLLSRPAARRQGPVAFLGLARAARAPSAAVAGLPLLTLLVALTVSSFGGTVLAGIGDGRDRAALLAVGADARLESPSTLPPPVVSGVRDTAGVQHVSGVHLYYDGMMANSGRTVTMAVVDPGSYARLAARTGLGAYPADGLDASGSARGGPVPALVSRDLARTVKSATEISVPGLQVSVRTALVRDSTPAAPIGDFVVVSRTALEHVRPDTADTALVAPNTLLLSGSSPDRDALRALAGKAGTGDDATLTLRATERSSYSDSVFQSGAERFYLAAVLASAGFSALAVLLSLLQTAPDRIMLLARLRTLGMPRGQRRRLILTESLPLYVLTAAAGVLTALASVPLLRPGLDLTTLAGTPDSAPVSLGADPVSLALPTLCLLVLASAALLVQARAAARKTDLRMESL